MNKGRTIDQTGLKVIVFKGDNRNLHINKEWERVAATAQWFHLHLPSCSPGFESQTHYLAFFNLYY